MSSSIKISSIADCSSLVLAGRADVLGVEMIRNIAPMTRWCCCSRYDCCCSTTPPAAVVQNVCNAIFFSGKIFWARSLHACNLNFFELVESTLVSSSLARPVYLVVARCQQGKLAKGWRKLAKVSTERSRGSEESLEASKGELV